MVQVACDSSHVSGPEATKQNQPGIYLPEVVQLSAGSDGVMHPLRILLLEAAYVIRLLPPYFENFRRRIVRSPKLYFLDPALVAALTRQPGAEAALAGAMGGALFEGPGRQRGLQGLRDPGQEEARRPAQAC